MWFLLLSSRVEAIKYLQVYVNVCNLVYTAEFSREDPEQAPSKRLQFGALYLIQIWLNPMGTYRVSKTDMVIRSEVCEDNITEPSPKNNTVTSGRERA